MRAGFEIDSSIIYDTCGDMGRKKAGGYIFEWYIGDHEPFHVYVYEGNYLIGRFDIVNQRPMEGWTLTQKIKKALKQVGFGEDNNGIRTKKN